MLEETISFMLALTETQLRPGICDAEAYMEGFIFIQRIEKVEERKTKKPIT